jgi:hypothetical protein
MRFLRIPYATTGRASSECSGEFALSIPWRNNRLLPPVLSAGIGLHVAYQ